jgi:hypothetical protein
MENNERKGHQPLLFSLSNFGVKADDTDYTGVDN